MGNATQTATDADTRYDEAARKLMVTEQELERAEERADLAERKVKQLEEETGCLTNNLRSLERYEEKASQRRTATRRQSVTCHRGSRMLRTVPKKLSVPCPN